MTDRLSSETVHATSVAFGGHAVLILGPSGSGKSDLALRLFDRGFTLVSDDQTIVHRVRHRLIASAPATIRGRMEVRGIGIIEVEAAHDTEITLAVELTSDVPRMPDAGLERRFLGVAVPLVRLDATSASTPAKIALALARATRS